MENVTDVYLTLVMYVVETAAGSIEAMKITVINAKGAHWIVDVLPEFTIDKLKLMALSHFFNPIDSIKVAEHYKLLVVSPGRLLPEESTVRDENIQENDELLLLKRRPVPPPSEETIEEKEEKSRGPTETKICYLTADIPAKNMHRVVEDSSTVVDFYTELRKIIVSLVKASEKLLRYHPEVVSLFKEMAEETPEREADVDHSAVKQLTDMGFPEDKVVSALRIHSNPMEAMEYMLAQEADQGTSHSPSASSSPSYLPVSKLSLRRNAGSSPSTSIDSPTPSTSDSTPAAQPSSQSPVVTMLQCFRAYKRKVFRPNMTALNNLKEMGFAEPDVLDALRINGNNQDTACEWLLSDKKLNVEDLECGLDTDGPIYKAIMANPVVQLGLSNPKTFLALLHMLENPNSACRWISDPDTAPILSQIFRIYHAEKHSLQLARPFLH